MPAELLEAAGSGEPEFGGSPAGADPDQPNPGEQDHNARISPRQPPDLDQDMASPRFHGTDMESIRRRLAELHEAERYDRAEWWRTLFLLNIWWVVGLGLLALGLHTPDLSFGRTCFAMGLGLGTGGPLMTMIWLYTRDH